MTPPQAQLALAMRLPIRSDKANGTCGYCLRGLTAALLPDGTKHYCCPVNCKPWMRGIQL